MDDKIVWTIEHSCISVNYYPGSCWSSYLQLPDHRLPPVGQESTKQKSFNLQSSRLSAQARNVRVYSRSHCIEHQSHRDSIEDDYAGCESSRMIEIRLISCWGSQGGYTVHVIYLGGDRDSKEDSKIGVREGCVHM